VFYIRLFDIKPLRMI